MTWPTGGMRFEAVFAAVALIGESAVNGMRVRGQSSASPGVSVVG